MGFKLGDFVKAEVTQQLALPEDRCPTTGKKCFPTKEAAMQAFKRQRGHRTKMRAFRCAICMRFHLGHRRGTAL